MSFVVRDLVLASPALKPVPKLVLSALAHWAQDDGTRVFPKVPDVAEKCGLSVRTVQRAIASLVDEKILVVVQLSTGRPGQANHYRIDLDVLMGGRVSTCHPSGDEPGGDGCHPVTRQDETGDRAGADGCQDVPTRVTHRSPVIENDQSSNQRNSENARGRAREPQGARAPAQRSMLLTLPNTPTKASASVPMLQSDARAKLRRWFTEAEITSWFGEDVTFSIAGNDLVVTVARPFVRAWIADHFTAKLAKAWHADSVTVRLPPKTEAA